MSTLDAWEAWLMLTCVLLIICWAVSAVVERISLHRRQFDHARRVDAAREQMRREVAS